MIAPTPLWFWSYAWLVRAATSLGGLEKPPAFAGQAAKARGGVVDGVAALASGPAKIVPVPLDKREAWLLANDDDIPPSPR